MNTQASWTTSAPPRQDLKNPFSDPMTAYCTAFVNDCYRQQRHVFSASVVLRFAKGTDPVKALHELAKSFGADPIRIAAHGDVLIEVLQWPQGVLAMQADPGAMSIGFATTSAEHNARLHAFVRERHVAEDVARNLHVLMRDARGTYYLHGTRTISVPLRESNYPRQMPKIRRLIEDLQSPMPRGRLSLLSGRPGTGKSFLIKALISEVNATVVFIPPHLITALTDPGVCAAFLNRKRHGLPTLLICEDADSILAKRASDNMVEMSTLLNLTDGLYGDIADIRVIATTNATRNETDKALMRAGRLSENIDFDELSPQEASLVLSELVDNAPAWAGGPVPLADIYLKARELGWQPPPILDPETKHEEWYSLPDWFVPLGNHMETVVDELV